MYNACQNRGGVLLSYPPTVSLIRAPLADAQSAHTYIYVSLGKRRL